LGQRIRTCLPKGWAIIRLHPPPPLLPFPIPSPEMQQPTPQLHSSFDSRAAHVHFCSHHRLLCRLVLNWIEFLKSFELNSEPHTGARPSVLLCVGPELARCVHIYYKFNLYFLGNINIWII
jgi:hypothetical protein